MENNGFPAPLVAGERSTIDAHHGFGVTVSHDGQGARSPRTDDGGLPGRRMSVTLVIPAKNEAANIAGVLAQVPNCVDEIILVDGHSTDATVITARACRPDVRVVTQEGTGKGSALRTGFLAATCDVIVMMDADASMSPMEIPHFLHFLSNGYDFVKGSRFMGGGGSLDITPARRWGNRALLGLFNSLYSSRLTDLCYGFCAFHRRYLSHLNLTATGFEIEAEMVVRATQAGLRVAEVPSLESPRRAGRSNLNAVTDGTRVLRTVVRHHHGGISGHLVQSLRKRVHGHPKTVVA
ncbi:MAG TPA: glycosyltransferase family 2 protein [Kineosporiaceae bacterium]